MECVPAFQRSQSERAWTVCFFWIRNLKAFLFMWNKTGSAIYWNQFCIGLKWVQPMGIVHLWICGAPLFLLNFPFYCLTSIDSHLKSLMQNAPLSAASKTVLITQNDVPIFRSTWIEQKIQFAKLQATSTFITMGRAYCPSPHPGLIYLLLRKLFLFCK